MAIPDLQQQFVAYIKAQKLFGPKDRLLLAVSGGLDSSVLCALCHHVGFSFSIAHCNFGLRGAESQRDEAFVQQLAKIYAVPVMVKHFETAAFAANNKMSIQVAARSLRYAWFKELMDKVWVYEKDQWNALTEEAAGQRIDQQTISIKHQYLLTAHHLDDNIETVALHFFKGTGISGLRGMVPKKNYLVRPLLFARRSELEAFAQKQNLAWVEDSSNDTTKYTRNFFRKELLPLIEQKVPQAMENIASSIPRFLETEMLYQQAVEGHKKKLLEWKGTEVHIPVLKLARVQPLNTIVYEVLKDFGFKPAQTPDVVRLLESETGKYVRSGTHQVLRHRAWLIIAPLQTEAQTVVLLEGDKGTIPFEGGTISWEKIPVPKNLDTAPTIALLDAKKIVYPLMFRRMKQGDYFYPLGLAKKKKVSRFLSSQKLSKIAREQVWVLQSGNRIAWVAGHRLDNRFKINTGTPNVVKITIVQNPAGTTAPRQ